LQNLRFRNAGQIVVQQRQVQIMVEVIQKLFGNLFLYNDQGFFQRRLLRHLGEYLLHALRPPAVYASNAIVAVTDDGQGNGDLVRLGPGEPGIIDQLPSGRLYKDGTILEDAKSRAVIERRRLGFAGCVFVAVAMTEKGELADDPEVDLVGIPEKNVGGEELDDIVFDVVVSTIEGLPRARRRDPDALAESVRRAVRAVLNEQWGKKPICLVHVLEV